MPRLVPSNVSLREVAYARIKCAAGMAACMGWHANRSLSTGSDGTCSDTMRRPTPPSDQQQHPAAAAAPAGNATAGASSTPAHASTDNAAANSTNASSSAAASSTDSAMPLCMANQRDGVRTARINSPRWAAAFYGNIPGGLLTTAAQPGWGGSAFDSTAGSHPSSSSSGGRREVTWEAICSTPEMQRCFPLLTKAQRYTQRAQQQLLHQQQQQHLEQHLQPPRRRHVRAALTALACSRTAYQLATAAGHKLLSRKLTQQRRQHLGLRGRGRCYHRPQPLNWAAANARRLVGAGQGRRGGGCGAGQVAMSGVTMHEDGRLSITGGAGLDDLGWALSWGASSNADDHGEEWQQQEWQEEEWQEEQEGIAVELSDSDWGPAVAGGGAWSGGLAGQQQRSVFSTPHNVIYGFWSQVPAG